MLHLLFALQAATTHQPPAISLGAPDRVFPVDFTQVRGVRELSDGRVLISDRLDKGVVAADFMRGTITRIGRTGSGPAEYRLPTTLAFMPGDSTLLSDEGNQRLAVIGPDLKIHRTFTLMLPGIGVPMGARAVDRQGRYYLHIPAWVSRNQSAGDTIVIVRFDASTQQVDTIARVKGSTPRKNTMRAGLPYVLFAPQDAWNVTPDGRLAVVRSADYRVEWRDSQGRLTSGRPIPFARRAVSMRDRLDHVRRFMQGSNISGKNGDGGLSPLPAEMLAEKSIREVVDHQEYAPEHPPFVGSMPLIGPDASLWIERSVAPGTPQQFDLVGADGTVARRIQLPRGRRLVALGSRWLYAVQTDEDGLQHLERYAYPR
ncbi:MAG TPA: hypothetical protein VFZ73_17300 [Gemmatimonadaceae bacterium]